MVIYNAPRLWKSSLACCSLPFSFRYQQVPELLTFQAGAETRGTDALICLGMPVCPHCDPRTKPTLQCSSLLQQQLLEDSITPRKGLNHSSSLRKEFLLSPHSESPSAVK
ncbi:hypothetical protein CHARACLAT_032522 [Characodon lateralis]|uniref:Uncharacterized protein n=1 Tax=Characodon lateralis TaxID=208331 RepID=A0ABU7EYP5_9TELE|nr:hypothetical protein [Characodon lateralis]